MAWQRFVDPWCCRTGANAEYITALPKAEHDAVEWQIAMETLLLVAERNWPEMLARIAVEPG